MQMTTAVFQLLNLYDHKLEKLKNDGMLEARVFMKLEENIEFRKKNAFRHFLYMTEWATHEHDIHHSLTDNITKFLRIEKRGDHLEYNKGDVVVKKGDPADCIYLVTEGEMASNDGAHLVIKPGQTMVYYALTTHVWEQEFTVTTDKC
eukprot:UN24260